MIPFYPQLNVGGASLRAPVLSGIGWIEGGYYDSFDDRDGTEAFLPNSTVHGLIGFERQFGGNTTINAQYQSRKMLNYDAYVAQLSGGAVQQDETYHLVTSRLMRHFRMETITLSLFGFFSPSDEDYYARFSLSYKYTDNLTLAVGGNVFGGADTITCV
jgi:hypothetical protein